MNQNTNVNIKLTYPNRKEFKNIELTVSQIANKSIQEAKMPLQGLALNEDKTINKLNLESKINNNNNNELNFKKEILIIFF